MALGILDKLAIALLNGPASPDVDSANRRMADLVSHVPPIGENYRFVRLGGSPASYALVVNFGLSGPAAVRIYSNSSGYYGLAPTIDHFVQKGFFDSHVEFNPESRAPPLSQTVPRLTEH